MIFNRLAEGLSEETRIRLDFALAYRDIVDILRSGE